LRGRIDLVVVAVGGKEHQQKIALFDLLVGDQQHRP